MGAINIDADLGNSEKAIAQLVLKTKDLRPALQDIGEYFLSSIEGRFKREEDPSGQRWFPLAAATLKRKKGNQILTETGKLRKSFTYLVSEESVEIGTDVAYAAIHQTGGAIEAKSVGRSASRSGKRQSTRSSSSGFGGRNIPARPILGINQQDRDEIVAIVLKHLQP